MIMYKRDLTSLTNKKKVLPSARLFDLFDFLRNRLEIPENVLWI